VVALKPPEASVPLAPARKLLTAARNSETNHRKRSELRRHAAHRAPDPTTDQRAELRSYACRSVSAQHVTHGRDLVGRRTLPGERDSDANQMLIWRQEDYRVRGTF
jgi:hypothetical protein